MKPTGRSAAVALLAIVLLVACTGGDDGSNGPTDATTTTFVPTPAETFTGAPGTAVYTYANGGGLVVTVELEGNTGTMTVDNGTEGEVGPPGVYVLDAIDGHEIDGEVAAAAPIAAGERATFDLTVDEITYAENIGLLVLLLGDDNYGAFVRTG
jgi:hypothetical protein